MNKNSRFQIFGLWHGREAGFFSLGSGNAARLAWKTWPDPTHNLLAVSSDASSYLWTFDLPIHASEYHLAFCHFLDIALRLMPVASILP